MKLILIVMLKALPILRIPARTLQLKLKLKKMEIGIKMQLVHGLIEELVRKLEAETKPTLKQLILKIQVRILAKTPVRTLARTPVRILARTLARAQHMEIGLLTQLKTCGLIN